MRAMAKVIGTTMIHRGDRVMTLSDDGKHVQIVDAKVFNETHQVVSGPEATKPVPAAET